jgi:hypothetical protein
MRRSFSMLTVAVLALSALGFACNRRQMTLAEFEVQLDRVVPAGTSLDRVLVVLDSLRMPHAAYDPNSRALRARLSQPPKQGISRTFQVTFNFDERQKVVSRDVRERFTGP